VNNGRAWQRRRKLEGKKRRRKYIEKEMEKIKERE
jgi:hypothetical protein